MMEIELSKDKFAIVDDYDFEWVSQYNWCINHYGYAVRNPRKLNGVRKPGSIWMHREIFGNIPDGIEVDHIDRNPLNNCRSNLRFCTSSENKFNRETVRNEETNFIGVRKIAWSGNYRARICLDRKEIHIGTFPTAEAAARARDEFAKKHRPGFARLNFPETT